MTREQLQRNWDAMEAFMKEKPIQYQSTTMDWVDYDGTEPSFEDFLWRPKPTPKERWNLITKMVGVEE